MTTTDTTNGRHHPQGRAAPKLPAFTFPDSGITVGLRRFAPDTQDTIMREVMRQNPAPPIPLVEGVEKEDGTCEMEENPADPDYQRARSAYMQRITLQVNAKMTELALRRIEVEVDQEAVDAFKADMVAIGAPLPDTLENDTPLDDRAIYIRHICISSVYDLTAMMAYFQRRSLPTEEAVQEFLDSFRG
jgi:hypothetical protein